MEVAIVGSGFGGIAMAIALRRQGIDDVVLYERASDLGGVWHYNTYPGAACDIPSYLYSYSFAQRPDWVRPCPPQRDILRYLHEVAREHGVEERIRLNTEIVDAAFDDATARWTLTTAGGERVGADALVLACGQLSRPQWPRIEGLEDFAGDSFHSAEWDHDHDLRGRRVAVIGTGASAIQFVPEIAEQVAQLDVYQRSPPWMLPRRNPDYPRWFLRLNARVRAVPRARRALMRLSTESLTAALLHGGPPRWTLRAWSALFMRRQLPDPELRRKVWPDYPIGCKRILFSSYWLPALARPNVEVVTDRIARITPRGIVTADGVERPADTLIYGTGFAADKFVAPLRVHGAGGRELQAAWRDGAQAHLGITVAGFPNMFLLYGPNTNLGSGSIIRMLEAQVGYVADALRRLRASGARAVDVRPEVQAASTAAVQERLNDSVWAACQSWYRVAGSGRITNNWPGQIFAYARATRQFDAASYRFLRAAA